MAKIPTSDQIYGARPIPRSQQGIAGYQAGIVEEAQAYAGRALQGTGQYISQGVSNIEAEREKRQAERDKEREKANARQNALTEARARTDFLKKQIELKTSFAQRDDYENFEKEYQTEFANVVNNHVGQFASADASEFFKVWADGNQSEFAASVGEIVRQKKNNAITADSLQRLDDISQQIASEADPNIRAEMIRNGYIIIENGFPDMDQVGKYKANRDFKEQVSLAYYESETPENVLKQTKAAKFGGEPVPISKNDTINFLLDSLEGKGVTKEPTGDFSQWGVRSGMYPNLAKKIESGTLTREEAYAIYSKDYYKGLEQYPENMRPVIFDMKVNGFKDIEAAVKRSGGDVSKLLGERRAYYSGLAKESPETYGQYLAGWMSRTDKLEGFITGRGRTGTPLDNLSEKQVRELEGKAIGDIAQNISELDPSNIATLVETGYFDQFDEKHKKMLMGVAGKAMEEGIALRETERSFDSLTKMGEIFSKQLDGTLTYNDISQAKRDHADDPNLLKMLGKIEDGLFLTEDDILKKALEGEVFKRRVAKEVEKKFPEDRTENASYMAKLDIADRLNSFGLTINKETGQIKNAGAKETMTQMTEYLALVGQYVKAKLITPAEGEAHSAIVYNAIKQMHETAKAEEKSTWWPWDATVRFLETDPNYRGLKRVESFLEQNKSVDNVAVRVNLYTGILENLPKYQQNAELPPEKQVEAAFIDSIRSVFPDLAGADGLPSKIVDADGNVIKLPTGAAAAAPAKPDSKILPNFRLLDRYEMTSGGFVTLEQIQAKAVEKKLTPEQVVMLLRRKGVIK